MALIFTMIMLVFEHGLFGSCATDDEYSSLLQAQIKNHLVEVTNSSGEEKEEEEEEEEEIEEEEEEEDPAQSLEDLLGESKCPLVIGLTLPSKMFGYFTDKDGKKYSNSVLGFKVTRNKWVRNGGSDLVYKNADENMYMYYYDGRWQIGNNPGGVSTPKEDASFRTEPTSAKCPDGLKWSAYATSLSGGLMWTDAFQITSYKTGNFYWAKAPDNYWEKNQGIADCVADWAMVRAIQEGSSSASAYCSMKPFTKPSKTYETVSTRCADYPDAGGLKVGGKAATCPDIKRFCDNEGGTGDYLRKVCPFTCGVCDGPQEFRTDGAKGGGYRKVCPKGWGVKEYRSDTLFCGKPEPAPSDAKPYWARGGVMDDQARCRFGYVATKIRTRNRCKERRLYCVPW